MIILYSVCTGTLHDQTLNPFHLSSSPSATRVAAWEPTQP
ncbi:hypothetical protein DVU_2726 [Nitratidesulfovibrio vulgaris str. Hildenborough]|uniref:Uncharacterized protein n=1 Tax=Nitratidesulfovibrio vulgaris (strain ATCC 29579 / DSM 644 / CCUG 34227 / NCIMB 8303 / VKM B-1760 / Hildenborough) TaxID=882 RepID=Q727X8_NITV2|nr:hypothetical protein DVU_2726 [Nitratidesulfovibrio vulgaris str. Hildenborough]